MSISQFNDAYRELVNHLKSVHDGDTDTAMRSAVGGGDFERIGMLERDLLIRHGLHPDAYLIDVGCGSGRLAKPLSEYLRGPYLGIDVVPDLVDYARNLVQRPDWRFEVAEGLSITEGSGRADMVCFFSVFTHLLHEHSYMYLREAKRVLKPGGCIVFSFLEFRNPAHWDTFLASVRNTRPDKVLTMFMDRDAIAVWAQHLGMKIEGMQDGGRPQPHPVGIDSGAGSRFFQSVCVLRNSLD